MSKLVIFQGALAIAKKLPSESYHYLVDAFPTILPPKHGSETSAAFVLNIDNQFARPLRAFKVIKWNPSMFPRFC